MRPYEGANSRPCGLSLKARHLCCSWPRRSRSVIIELLPYCRDWHTRDYEFSRNTVTKECGALLPGSTIAGSTAARALLHETLLPGSIAYCQGVLLLGSVVAREHYYQREWRIVAREHCCSSAATGNAAAKERCLLPGMLLPGSVVA